MTVRHVYIVEDEEPIRHASQMMLKLMGCAPRGFESGVAFLQEHDDLEPGCVLLDIRMPEIDGLEVQRRLNAAGAGHSVIVMSGHGDLSVAVPAVQSGAVAFLEKPFSRQVLQQALDTAFLRLEDPGGYSDYLETAAQAVRGLERLEKQVLALMIAGHRTEAIADQLGVAETDIEMSKSSLFARLGIESVIDAIRLAVAAEQTEDGR